MKTILVIYTDTKIIVPNYKKRYAFNTEANLKEGDMIKSPDYETNMQVVKILDKAYIFFNKVTGELTDEFNNANQYTIRELKLFNEEKNVVYASIIKPVKEIITKTRPFDDEEDEDIIDDYYEGQYS